MIVGMGIGAIVSPNLIAQSDGVFNDITCRRLQIVDKDRLIRVSLSDDGVRVYNERGESAIGLISSGSGLGSFISIINPQGNLGILLVSNEEKSHIELYSPPEGDKGVNLFCSESGRGISIEGYAEKEEIRLQAAESIDPFIAIEDRAGRVKVISR